MMNLKEMKRLRKRRREMLPPLLDGMPSRHKIALQISLGLSTRSEFSWLEPLPVTQEAAGSSPVAPANLMICDNTNPDALLLSCS
jgi:hypothetical protein